jgi:hypothetical protein
MDLAARRDFNRRTLHNAFLFLTFSWDMPIENIQSQLSGPLPKLLALKQLQFLIIRSDLILCGHPLIKILNRSDGLICVRCVPQLMKQSPILILKHLVKQHRYPDPISSVNPFHTLQHPQRLLLDLHIPRSGQALVLGLEHRHRSLKAHGHEVEEFAHAGLV